MGLATVQDLWFHLPLRYEDRTRLTPPGQLRPGMAAVTAGCIAWSEVQFGRRRTLLTRISDGSGELTIRQFHFSAAQHAQLQPGKWLRCYGEVRRGPHTLEMVHPEYAVFAERPPAPAEQTLTPVYPATDGVGQRILRRVMAEALAPARDAIVDLLPVPVARRLALMPLVQAVLTVHRPPSDADAVALAEGCHPAQRRLAFEELLAHHLSFKRRRAQRRAEAAPVLGAGGDLVRRFVAGLDFELTGAQQRVINEVLADLGTTRPALRLVQGDVGSGKTVVAAAAALAAAEAGYQSAIMAPTELLAEQHQRNFAAWLAPLGLQAEVLLGRMPARVRRAAVARIGSGEVPIAIGTHALFQEAVVFQRLGLVVIDEQHRFGVDQRLALLDKGRLNALVPHQIIMTATPIPRSLAMTFYADLDVSSIDELPPGRLPVETAVLPGSRRAEVQERVRAACRAGQQAYWVCPLIDESDVLQAQAASETDAGLREALPELRIGLVHGRMKAADKDRIMGAFRAGEIDLLVATTVVEVGVDVPNASLMIIESVERLGLAQLHQLRGRVGRGAARACCVLLYETPLGHSARQRLAVLRKTSDGFRIAQYDLEQRGPGELLGKRQTGTVQFRAADLVRDQALLPAVERAAAELLAEYPQQVVPLIDRWLASAEQYASV